MAAWPEVFSEWPIPTPTTPGTDNSFASCFSFTFRTASTATLLTCGGNCVLAAWLSLMRKRFLAQCEIIFVKLVDGAPTIVIPENELSTASIGFAIATELLPAKSRPTARGVPYASSTINDPESPLSIKLPG